MADITRHTSCFFFARVVLLFSVNEKVTESDHVFLGWTSSDLRVARQLHVGWEPLGIMCGLVLDRL